MEIINPAETFGDIMIDYPYVECSSASLQALAAFAARFPDDARVRDIARASTRGRAFLKSIQKPDGSWYGSWAVCFTYGTWFGVKGLLATGSTYATCAALRKATAFLLSKQMADGGWGESYLSCQNKKYVQLTDDKRTGAGAPVDHIVNTAWALLALVAAGQAERDPAPLHAAARALMRRQRENGDFPQQTIMGVFNNNCMITYANYRNIFPIWALGEYAKAVHGPGVSPRVEDAAAAKSAAGAPPAARGAAKPAAGKPPKAPAAQAGAEAGTPLLALKVSGSSAALSSAGDSSGGDSPYSSDGGGGATGRKPRKSSSQKQRTSSKKKGKGKGKG